MREISTVVTLNIFPTRYVDVQGRDLNLHSCLENLNLNWIKKQLGGFESRIELDHS